MPLCSRPQRVGALAETEVTNYVVKWYFLFLMFHVFLVSVVGGSLVSSFKQWVANPSGESLLLCPGPGWSNRLQ